MKKTLFLLLLALAACTLHAQTDDQPYVSPTETDDWYYDTITATTNPEIDPEFPGGDEALKQYLCDSLRWPGQCDVQGKVYIEFVVEKDGSLTNIQCKRNIVCGTGEEGDRLVRAMPRWKPGMVNGEPVRTLWTIPIIFDRQ